MVAVERGCFAAPDGGCSLQLQLRLASCPFEQRTIRELTRRLQCRPHSAGLGMRSASARWQDTCAPAPPPRLRTAVHRMAVHHQAGVHESCLGCQDPAIVTSHKLELTLGSGTHPTTELHGTKVCVAAQGYGCPGSSFFPAGGLSHGVLLLNSNGMDAPPNEPSLTYRGLWPCLVAQPCGPGHSLQHHTSHIIHHTSCIIHQTSNNTQITHPRQRTAPLWSHEPTLNQHMRA